MRVETAAENAFLKLIARGAMIVAVGLVGFFGPRVLDALDKNTQANWELRNETVRLSSQIDNLKQQMTSQVTVLNGQLSTHADLLRALAERNNQQDSRIDKVDEKIGTMQQQLWRFRVYPQAPAASPSSAQEGARHKWEQP